MSRAALAALVGLVWLPGLLASGRQLASIEGWTPGGGPKFEPAQRPRIIKGEPVSNLPEAEAQVFYDTVVALFNLPIAAPGCGGALVEASTVLTAAHCVDFLSPTAARKLKLWYNGTSVKASNIFIHPGWVPDTEIVPGVPRYDIAAVKLETPIVGAKVAALVRPDADLGTSGLELQVAGFGETETAFISKLLMHTTVKYLTPEDCPRKAVSDGICAGITADACSGDSGGPLFLPPVNTNPPILIGLVSYGPDCDATLSSGSTPVGFYTDLRRYYDAIMAWVDGRQVDWKAPGTIEA